MPAAPADPCTVLTTLGYTPREAAFLRMVAMHSGVFLRRQYVAFTAAGQGKAVHGFIAKLVTKRHGRPISYGDNQTLHHLTNKRLYRILGIEDSNNRRGRSDQTLKARLMALDFVIANAEAHWLETEAEKVAFFRQTFGASTDQLPAKTYLPNRSKAPACSRYFVEKFPIFVAGNDASTGFGTDPSAPPVVAFSFIDDGQVTVSSFSSFLSRYAPLMGLIPRFRLYYLTDTPTKFAPAERQFARLMAMGHGSDGGGQDHSAEQYAHLMARWQEGKSNFSSDEFAELARLRRLHAGHETEPSTPQTPIAPTCPQPPSRVLGDREAAFIAFPLPNEYRFCGELRAARRRGRMSPGPSPTASPAPSPHRLTQLIAPEPVRGDSSGGSGHPSATGPVGPPAGNDPASAGFGQLSLPKVPSRSGGTSRPRQGADAPSRCAAAAPKAGTASAPNHDDSSIED